MGPQGKKLLIALVVTSVTFMELLDATILNTALPQMARSLRVDVIDLKAAITCYLVSLSIFIPVSGWIADRFGSKSTILAAITLFTAGSAACGSADGMTSLIIFRIVQGMGGAMMTPVARLSVIRLFPGRDLVRIAGIVAIPPVFGPVLGPLVGGYITTHFSWPWIFYVNVPIGIAAAAAIALLLTNDRQRETVPFDAAGFALAGSGLALLSFLLETVDDQIVGRTARLLLLAAGAALLALALRHCLRVRHPVFALSLYRFNSFRIGALQTVLGLTAGAGFPFLIGVLLQIQFGWSPLQAGGILFCAALGTLVVKPLVTPLINRWGCRTGAASAPLGLCIGFLLMTGFSRFTPAWQMAFAVFFAGCFYSIQMNIINALPYLQIPVERTSRATSLQSTVQQFSMSLGVTFSALLLDHFLHAQSAVLGAQADTDSVVAAFHYSIAAMALLALLNAAVGLLYSPAVRAERVECAEGAELIPDR